VTAVAGAERIRVVLADDTEDVRHLVRVLLERAGGFEVVGEAADGVEVVEAAGRLQPDLVVLDLAMPAMDGLQALPRILKEAPHAKVVVLSGFQAEQISDEARRYGAHAYVEKGATGPELIATLNYVLGLSTTPAPRPRPPGPPEEQVLSALIHELSAPVTAIEGFADLIDMPFAELDPATFDQAMGAIRRNASHLRGLLTAFADARRVDVDALDLRLEATDVGALVEELAESLVALVAPHPVALSVAPTRPAQVDRTRLRQVLFNLVRNAAKFSPPEEAIDIEVGPAGDDAVRVTVIDRGAGVPSDQLHRLFGKFARLQYGTPGTGLGLYISRGIARAHGGDLVLEETSPAGSRFALTLPIGSEP
jgi:signal transduction histidine kinase